MPKTWRIAGYHLSVGVVSMSSHTVIISAVTAVGCKLVLTLPLTEYPSFNLGFSHVSVSLFFSSTVMSSWAMSCQPSHFVVYSNNHLFPTHYNVLTSWESTSKMVSSGSCHVGAPVGWDLIGSCGRAFVLVHEAAPGRWLSPGHKMGNFPALLWVRSRTGQHRFSCILCSGRL